MAKRPNALGKKPPWLRVRLPAGDAQAEFLRLQSRLRSLSLATVCEEARCPNIYECWGQGTATIMVLGDTCTRGCRFCSVATGKRDGAVDPNEPRNTGEAIMQMQLAYVVLTMVDRDDLVDGGARHVAETIQAIRAHSPNTRVETLVGDFQGDSECVRVVVQDGAPDVFAHNVEVVPELQRVMRDARCSWTRSLSVLEAAKSAGSRVTKSSLMVGVGETQDQVITAMRDLRSANVDVVTIGQYLQPNAKLAPVQRYVDPAEFDAYRSEGEAMGFTYVASGPLVRSSYKAAEAFMSSLLDARDGREPRHAPVAVSPALHDGNAYGKRRLTLLQ